jgi:hypothetical protein
MKSISWGHEFDSAWPTNHLAKWVAINKWYSVFFHLQRASLLTDEESPNVFEEFAGGTALFIAVGRRLMYTFSVCGLIADYDPARRESGAGIRSKLGVCGELLNFAIDPLLLEADSSLKRTPELNLVIVATRNPLFCCSERRLAQGGAPEYS